MYPRRPKSAEQELWHSTGDQPRISMLGDSLATHAPSREARQAMEREEAERKNKRSREEEEQHKRMMMSIYEKYGSTHKATSATTGASKEDILGPDVMRLG
eukprot:gnl/TRDRNA2_/TRDRNA2_127361_c0_seq3.p1 gnl/TRDRNA2_/TRDRNA2_127361_c0~~gnl/TRDRNA2_/TRDRNA2_127361_c0_seq3.p1  ORF type:complete len:101 (+),score=17.72 gnl/TRDRNA2_/TRDRNA2_127361_c0_seq3:303-605(+)